MNNLIFIMASRGWAWNIIRSLFGWLDSVAYFLFASVMQLIFDIIAVTSDPAFSEFYEGIYSRIYALIAIYMLFKIIVSMLTYLVNPDSINDKERGVGKMATRVIVALIMLIAFPNVFGFMNKIQPHIIEAIPRVILATNTNTSGGNDDLSSQMSATGKQIAFDTYNGVWFNNNCADKDTSQDNDGQPICFKYGNTVDIAVAHINDAADGDSSEYRYNYFPLVGFVTGIVMTIILLGFCVDVSIRVFKLIILQILAPIPIISYIDPKSSKDGAFSKWIKMVGSVYLDIFIKLSIIYFVLLVISELITSGTVVKVALRMFGENGMVRSGMVLVALVIGLFFFAKEAPKFIADALGIKMSENGKLFGGLGKIAAAATLGAGAIGSGIASGKASFMSDEANGKNHNVGRILKNVGAGIVGAASGLGTGANAVLNAKDHHAKAAMDAMAKRNATALAAGASGSTFFGRMGSTLMGLTTGETSAAIGKREIADLEASKAALETVKSRASGEMVKQDWTWGNLGLKDANGNDLGLQANYKSFMAAKNAAASAGKSSFEVQLKDENGNIHTHMISMETANMQEGFLLKNNEDDYIKQNINGTAEKIDNVLIADISNAEKVSGVTITGRNTVTDNIDSLGVQIMNKKRENSKKAANDRFSGTKNG